MKTKNKTQHCRQKASSNDKHPLKVERRPDGGYDVTMTGWLAKRFLAANGNLQDLIGRKISEAHTFGNILDEAISDFELGNPL